MCGSGLRGGSDGYGGLEENQLQTTELLTARIRGGEDPGMHLEKRMSTGMQKERRRYLLGATQERRGRDESMVNGAFSGGLENALSLNRPRKKASHRPKKKKEWRALVYPQKKVLRTGTKRSSAKRRGSDAF